MELPWLTLNDWSSHPRQTVSICSRWWLPLRLTNGMEWRTRGCRIFSPKWTIYTLPSPPGSVIIRKRAGETVRDRGGERIQENSVLWTCQASCTCDPEAVRTSPRKAHAGPNSSMESRGGIKSHPTQELSATDSCWERKSVLSLGVLSWLEEKTDTSLVGKEVGWIWEKIGDWMNTAKIHCTLFSKN